MTHARAVDLLSVMETGSISELDIMGGEPFLLPWMPLFMHEAVRRGIRVNVSTNGSIQPALRGLAGIYRERINVGISVEGSTAGRHNKLTRSRNFGSAMRSISLLVSLGLDPIVKTVVSRRNMSDIQGIISLVKTLGVLRYYLIHMDLFSTDQGQMKEALGFPEFMEFHRIISAANPGVMIGRVNASCFEKHLLPEGARCAGGVKKLSIMPDGSVFPCNLLHRFPEFRLGNIFRDYLPALWRDAVPVFFRRSEGSCSRHECSNRGNCTGGCPAHGYYHFKEQNSPDVRCL